MYVTASKQAAIALLYLSVECTAGLHVCTGPFFRPSLSSSAQPSPLPFWKNQAWPNLAVF